ncbi:MAG: DUF4340 domain-containing protein [Desulfococcus multivorans]|jgi:hypothetical protein|nr:DUF4340 domain-containing protein [Desulfococcus multivorans]
MTGKTRLAALAAANAFLLASLVYGLFFSTGAAAKRSGNAPLSRMFPAAGPQGITLRDAEETVLRRDGEGWTVMLNGKPFPADPGKVEGLVRAAGEARPGRIVTENRGLWERFGVGDDAPARIVFSFPGGTVELILGEEEESGGGQYVRFPGTDAVRLLSRSLAFYTVQKTSYWSFLRLFPGDLDGRSVTSVTVEKGPATALFRENAGGGLLWKRPGGGVEVDQRAADSLADLLARLSGTEFANDEERAAAGLENPALRVSFTTAGRKTHAVAFGGPAGEGRRYCAGFSDGKPLPHLYKIGDFTYDRIGKLVRELAEAP